MCLAWTALAGSALDSPTAAPVRVALIRLENRSSYNGPWDISRHLSRQLQSSLSANTGMQAAPAADVSEASHSLLNLSDDVLDARKIRAVGRACGSDIVISGTIDHFTLEGQSGISYRVGGLERFVGEVTLTITVVDARSGAVLMDRRTATGKISDNDVGLALLKGPGYRETTNILQVIWDSPIDTDLVQGSVLGRAMQMVVADATAQISRVVSGVASGREGRVVRVRGQDIYINLGSEDDLRPGDLVLIWPSVEVLRDPKTSVMLGLTKPGSAAEAAVQEIRDKRLAICRSTDNSVREGDVVRFVGGQREGKWVGVRPERLNSAEEGYSRKGE